MREFSLSREAILQWHLEERAAEDGIKMLETILSDEPNFTHEANAVFLAKDPGHPSEFTTALKPNFLVGN